MSSAAANRSASPGPHARWPALAASCMVPSTSANARHGAGPEGGPHRLAYAADGVRLTLGLVALLQNPHDRPRLDRAVTLANAARPVALEGLQARRECGEAKAREAGDG